MVHGGDWHIRIDGEELLVMRAQRPSAAIHPASAAWMPDTASVTPKHSSGGTLSSLHPARKSQDAASPARSRGPIYRRRRLQERGASG